MAQLGARHTGSVKVRGSNPLCSTNMGRVRSKTVNEVQTSYQYDILGRVYQELSEKSFKGYFYEGISQYAKEQLVGINHQTMYSSTQYEYDAEMRIAQVKESGNLTATYTYDANGNKVSETLANGVVSTYSYNGCNKVTKLVTKSGNSDISSYEYSYYLDGSDACKVRNENGTIETTSYDYDGLKRLTRESISNGKTADTYSYEYDDYGNRSKMVANGSEEYETVYDYTVNGKYTALLQKEIKTVEETSNATISDGLAISPTDLITSTAADAKTEETAYSYDANGNQITKTAEGKTETNTYDGLNQLIGFTDGETTASYKYNADGLRTSKTVDGKTINHIWDGSKQIIVDMDDSDWYSAEVYVRGTNLLAKFSKQSGNVKTDYQYYTQNAHGDVVNLTDSTGAITKSYKYDAFGVEQNIDDADTNVFRYCGEYYDSESGTIYLRARYYDPTIGRFISRDSFAGKQGDPLSLNRYTYCHNSPVIYIDAEGNLAFLAAVGIGAGVGALISGAAKVIDNVRHDKDWNDGLGTAVLSGAVSGAISAIPIPGVGPLASAAITGAASNLAADAINGDINSFGDAALSLTEGATIGAVSHGVGKWVNKNLANSKLNSKPLSQGKNINNPAHNATQFERLKAQYAADEILNADRIGSALKSDSSHRAASFLSREQLAKGRVNTFRGGDGSHYTLLQTYGGLDNNSGIYEYVLNKKGQVTHQRFIKDGVMTGEPNQKPKRRPR